MEEKRLNYNGGSPGKKGCNGGEEGQRDGAGNGDGDGDGDEDGNGQSAELRSRKPLSANVDGNGRASPSGFASDAVDGTSAGRGGRDPLNITPQTPQAMNAGFLWDKGFTGTE
jgi:hypothetical protein